MFLIDVTEWVANWFWDTLDEIFITIFDFFLYGIVGFLYKVFVILGSMDIFGNSSEALELYTKFTNRLYGVIAIVMIFVLSYQIILFIIDPDKGVKASSELVKNLVRGIVLVALCPLIFHYAAVFQKHVLQDNTIWSVVLGTNSTSSDNPIEAGNSMATMVYMTMYHPAGTEYNDFYDADGKLKEYKDACKNFAALTGGDLGTASYNDDGQAMSSSSLRRSTTWGLKAGLLGSIFGVGWLTGTAGFLVGGAADIIHGLANWITGKEDPKITSCQQYWIYLYVASGGAAGPGDGEDINKMDAYDTKKTAKNPFKKGEKLDEVKIGYINGATVIAGDASLADEVRDEGTMEYFYFAPVVGAILVFMLIAYSLDMAYRAFKLAFLEMIAPIPILLGVIPKQDGIFKKWVDLIVKTYIDVFVRTFILAFVVFMIQLVPTFVKALFDGAKNDVGEGAVQGGALLKAVVIAFLVIGLLRFAKELPDMIKDIAKNGGGLLKDLDINPKNSFKKAKEGIDNATKPIGAAAGAIAGGAAALKSSHARNPKEGTGLGNVLRGMKGTAAFAKGFSTGGKEGWKNGLKKGSMTNAVNRANIESGRGELQRDAIFSAVKGVTKPGGVQNLAGILTNGRFGEFKNAWKNNLLDDQLLQAGTIYRDMANGGKQFFKGADSQIDTVKESTKKSLEGIKSRTLTDEQVTARKQAYDDAIAKLRSGDPKTRSINVDGVEYAANTQEELIKKLQKEQGLVSNSEYTTEYRGKTVRKYDYGQIETEVKNMERQAIREKQIEETAKVIADEGYGNVQLYAAKSQELDMRNKDILNPTQLKAQGDELEKAFKGTNGGRIQEFLKIDDSQKRDLGAITQALQKIDFNKISENGYTYIAGEKVYEDEVRKMVGELVVSISNAEGKVASKVRNIQSSIEGTKIDMVGRSMDNLTPTPPKGGDKGDKK